jgi:hypothetical protein
LTCNIFTGGVFTTPARVVSLCNLAWGRRVGSVLTAAGSLTQPASNLTLLLPAFTDIRDSLCSTGYDGVEVPAGSGRVYNVFLVDDLGKGFPNEHRGALLLKTVNGVLPWPTPIP